MLKDKLKEANIWADSLNIEVPTKDSSPYPEGKKDDETYGQYRQRIKKLEEKGFDIVRLTHFDYTDYCRGNYAPDEREFNDTVAYHEKTDDPIEE